MPGETPHPPRYWWLKRLLPLALLLVAAILGLRIAWGVRWSNRLAEAEAAIRARGEPLYLSDLAIEPARDEENKAYYYQRALALWPRVDGQLPGNHSQSRSSGSYYRGDEEERSPLVIPDDVAYLASLGPTLDLLRKGAAAPRADWKIQLATPAIQILLQHLGSTRELARAMTDTSERAQAIGDHHLAFELVELMFPLADAADGEVETLIEHLVGFSIRALAIERLREMLPTLPIAADDSKAVDSQRVRQLIQIMLDEDRQREGWTRSMITERAFTHDTVTWLVSGVPGTGAAFGAGVPAGGPLTRIFMKPLLQRDALFLLDWHSANIAAVRETVSPVEYEAHIRHTAPMFVWRSRTDQILRPLSSVLSFSFDGATRAHFQAIAQRRLAAAALAIRLYETEHGRRPATLEELVPDYLPSVPVEPYTGKDLPMRYRPEGVLPVRQSDGQPIAGASPVAIVYFDGLNGVDDGGRLQFDDDGDVDHGSFFGNQPGQDQVFPLDPLPLIPGPEHQRGVENEAGQ